MIDKPIPELKVDDLSRLYTEAEECDKRIFAEMRTNLQLVAGQHYVREGSRFYNRIRDDQRLTQEQRLKLTKNHIQRITKIYQNAIESYSPDVAIYPANESELQDQKAAQLHSAYWQYIKNCEAVEEKIATWVKNYIEIGEVWVKVFWSMDGGQIIGYNAMQDDDGNVMYDDQQNPIQNPSDPYYGGKINFETIEAYNLRRDPAARTMKESPYLIYTKLVPKNRIRAMVKDPEQAKVFEESNSTEEYNVYDNNTGTYRTVTGQVMVKEIYFRPGPALPNGYYFIFTSEVIIDEGELPYGIFPIIGTGFDEQTGNPRCHSVIRHCRPSQVEINRCASKIAEHQVTHGDDKILLQGNSKVSQGALLPGIRVATYTGTKEPTVLQGRNGDQYVGYMEKNINEMYMLANVSEVLEDQPENNDVYTSLFRSFKFRKKFSTYGKRFERFLIDVVKTALNIAKHSANEHELVPAVGRSEYINISEFKNSEEIHYQIKVEPRSDDIESQFGKQITLNHFIQYIGPKLERDDIGKMARLSPFLNKEKMFEDFTHDYDKVTNIILALDRGQWVPPRKYENHDYIIKSLTARMDKADYQRLPPVVQMLYEEKLRLHEEIKAQELIDIQRAQAGFIPSGGYLVACDFYVGDPENPEKTKRVRVPSEALNWLIEKLKTQGTNLEELEKMPRGVLQDIGNMMGQGFPQPGMLPVQGDINGQPRAA